MLFNSVEFIFIFLPIVLLIYIQLNDRVNRQFAIVWLVFSSLFFYSWWNPNYLGLIVFSIIFNYLCGKGINKSSKKIYLKRIFLCLGIALNLGLIAYFKYTNFLVDSINQITALDIQINQIILPLAISFFTFQQIAYLVDSYRGETKEYDFLQYCLFVTFFPQLIAGPIVHHKDILPQFQISPKTYYRDQDISVGLTIFIVGLFKKIILADTISTFSNPVFDAAAQGVFVNLLEAWIGALAYSLQLYFDFSGYSDMAIGIARLFGIKLPINFNSPYKAISISDFWRRWHITLSNFLRDYLYIPLGGNQKGKWRRNLNLMLTMLLGGLWHGAGWTFIFWGGLHGFYLIINHQWRLLRKFLGYTVSQSTWYSRLFGQALTFIAVVIGWVFFRATSFGAAILIIKGMFGLNGISLPVMFANKLSFLQIWHIHFDGALPNISPGFNFFYACIWIAGLLIIVWRFPNLQEWMANYNSTLPSLTSKEKYSKPDYKYHILHWHPNFSTSLILSVMVAVISIHLFSVTHTEFLYFNF